MSNIDLKGILKERPSNVRVPKTKIVCTIGLVSKSVLMLEKLLRISVNVTHFNFSHGTYQYRQETLDNFHIAIHNTEILCFVMLDTKGPEILTGFLKKGQEITVSTDYSLIGDEKTITRSYKKFPVDLKPGNTILCVDGTSMLTVLSCIEAGSSFNFEAIFKEMIKCTPLPMCPLVFVMASVNNTNNAAASCTIFLGEGTQVKLPYASVYTTIARAEIKFGTVSEYVNFVPSPPS